MFMKGKKEKTNWGLVLLVAIILLVLGKGFYLLPIRALPTSVHWQNKVVPEISTWLDNKFAEGNFDMINPVTPSMSLSYSGADGHWDGTTDCLVDQLYGSWAVIDENKVVVQQGSWDYAGDFQESFTWNKNPTITITTPGKFVIVGIIHKRRMGTASTCSEPPSGECIDGCYVYADSTPIKQVYSRVMVQYPPPTMTSDQLHDIFNQLFNLIWEAIKQLWGWLT